MRRALLAVLALAGLYGCYDYSLDPTEDGDTPPAKHGKSSSTDPITPSSVEHNASSSSSGATTTPPATIDAGVDASTTTTVTGNGCASNGMFCGGDALLKCNPDGTRTFQGKCANGCVNGACNAPTTCVAGGTYCGGDKVNGNPDVLYKCGADGVTATVQTNCANGCFVAPAGSDDYCK